MKKDLVQLAMAGLVAGFCLSAASPPLAMGKCSRDGEQPSSGTCTGDSCSGGESAPEADSESCSSNTSCSTSGASCSTDESDASSQLKSQRKSAARKVIEGS